MKQVSSCFFYLNVSELECFLPLRVGSPQADGVCKSGEKQINQSRRGETFEEKQQPRVIHQPTLGFKLFQEEMTVFSHLFLVLVILTAIKCSEW